MLIRVILDHSLYEIASWTTAGSASKTFTFICRSEYGLHRGLEYVCVKSLLRLKLRNGLQRIHICIFYQNINKNVLIKMLYVL